MSDILKQLTERIRGIRLTHEEVDALTKTVEECAAHLPRRRKTDVDPGAHYRGPNVFGIPLDPYRILEAYPNITREGARHVLKKVLRMGKKGIGERQLIAELRCCIDRWEQMLDEEDANAQAVAAAQQFEQQHGIFNGKPLAEPPPQTFFLNEQHTTKTTPRKARTAKKAAPKKKAKRRGGSLD